jgi:hypothetical protein
VLSYITGFPAAHISGWTNPNNTAAYSGLPIYPNEILNETGSQGAYPMISSLQGGLSWTSGIFFTGNTYYRV